MKQKQHPLKLIMKPVKQDLHLKKRKIADELACITHMITAIVIMMCCLKKLQIRIVSDSQKKQIQSKYLWMAVISQQMNLRIQTTQGQILNNKLGVHSPSQDVMVLLPPDILEAFFYFFCQTIILIYESSAMMERRYICIHCSIFNDVNHNIQKGDIL